MVFEEYRKRIEEMLKPMKSVLPPNTQILFECLAEPDEDLVSTEEYFLLVAPTEDPKRKRVLKDLIIHINMGYPSCDEKRERVENWLCKSIQSNEFCLCDFVEEQKNGSFVPNRFPEEFKYYGPDTSFLLVLS